MKADYNAEQDLEKLRNKGAARPKALFLVDTDGELINTSPRTNSLDLPKTDDNWRPTPKPFLRSALFSIHKSGGRGNKGKKTDDLDKVEIYSSEGGDQIVYSGPQLDQGDLDVWLQCIHLLQKSDSTSIKFSAYSFLKSLGRDPGKISKEWLDSKLSKLTKASVSFSNSSIKYDGRLLLERTTHLHSHNHEVTVSRKIEELFVDKTWCRVSSGQRLKLKNKPLAQWLHGFYITHQKPNKYGIAKIHKLCGSQNEDLVEFKKTLKSALLAVGKVTGWTMTIGKDNLLRVNRNASK